MPGNWPIRLFHKSVLKQNKFNSISKLLGPTTNLSCLDIGSDNGVISYLFRERGGFWKSADLDEKAVDCIRNLIHENVFQISGQTTPFKDNEFDRVVIIDFLEHIQTDRKFIQELFRIIKPGGELILNVPHIKNSFLRKLRLAMGQTDEKHGHVRPGYTIESLKEILGSEFHLTFTQTYSKFFSESVDTLMTLGLSLLKGKEKKSSKGMIVAQGDLDKHQKMFKIYSFIYPILWMFGKLDGLLFWRSGYMLLAKAKTTK